MNGLKKRKANLSFKINSNEYSGSNKNTLKSRIQSMDKGWIKKSKEIRDANRSADKLKINI